MSINPNQQIFTYLRASTTDQNAERAKANLHALAKKHGRRIARDFIENGSGATMDKNVRPELHNLIATVEHGDILLIEHVDRLTRMPADEWDSLKATLKLKGVIIVVELLEQTHGALSGKEEDRVIQLINGLIIDLAADSAHKDYLLRRHRQAQGIELAKQQDAKAVENGGKRSNYKGRQINPELHRRVRSLLTDGVKRSQREIARLVDCSRETVARVANQIAEEAAKQD